MLGSRSDQPRGVLHCALHFSSGRFPTVGGHVRYPLFRCCGAVYKVIKFIDRIDLFYNVMYIYIYNNDIIFLYI